MRRLLLALMPWYHEADVEERHLETRRTLRHARHTRAVIESYRAADERLGKMSGRE